MKKFAYIRVSTEEQNTNRQIDAMTALNIPYEQIFIDKKSGKNTTRPELQKLLAKVNYGDTIIVESVSRFARNTKDLLDLIDTLSTKGVEFISLKEQIDTTTPTGKFMLTIFGAVAELEREYTLQRQKEGIIAAKARGVHLGRPIKKPPANFIKLAKQWEVGMLSIEEFMKQTGLKKSTLYRRLREHHIVKRNNIS